MCVSVCIKTNFHASFYMTCESSTNILSR